MKPFSTGLFICFFTLPNLIVSKLNLINYSELHIIEDGKFIGYDLKMFLTIVMSFKLHDFIFTLSQGGPGRTSSTLTYEIYKLSFKNMQLGFGSAMSFYLLFFRNI